MLEIRLLGTFGLTVDDIPASSLRARAGISLLTALVLQAGKPMDREWLASTLWSDSNGEQARYNLRRNLTDLRKILGGEASRLHSPSTGTIAFDLSGAFCDVLAFDAAVAQEQWSEAIRLYTGPLLAGGEVSMILEEREVRETAYLQALEAVGEEALTHAYYREAIQQFQRVLLRKPGRESAVRNLMRAFVADGNRVEALLIYRNLRLYLHEQLLGQPHPETTTLYESLRGMSLLPAKTSPPIRRLPLPLTPIYGREFDLEQLIALLARHRWLTLVGMGGIGKTRLAREVTRFVSGESCFVDLASLDNSELLMATVRQALGIPQESEFVASLGDTEILLILDNCEHLLEAVADLIPMLLSLCPQLRLLATSREPIGGPDEVLFRVSPLQEEAAWQLFAERVHSAAAATFNTENFPLDEELMALCRALDGWPLALELAAAQVRSLPPKEVRKRLRLITPSRRVVPERQRSLQATLDWSWELLHVSEQVSLCRLSCFVGGWTVEAAEIVCAIAPETLATLVDKSLVEFDRDRYQFREPILQYIREQYTDEEERERLRQEHHHYFLALARNAEPDIEGPHAQQIRQKLTVEQDNLRQVLSDGGTLALQLACTLTMYWFRESLAKEGQYWLERLLVDHPETDSLRARTLHSAGVMAATRFDWVTAQIRAEEAVTIWRTLSSGSSHEQSEGRLLEALALWGSTLNNTGQHEQARDVYIEILAAHRKSGNTVAEAQALEDLGYAARSLADFPHAEKWLNQALTLYQKQGNEYRTVSAMGQLAMVRDGQGDKTGARNLMREVLRRYQKLGQGQSVAWAMGCLGGMERQLGNLPIAREHITEALERFRDSGSSLFWPLLELGLVARAQGQNQEARTLFQQARAEAIASGVPTIVQQIDSELHTLPH